MGGGRRAAADEAAAKLRIPQRDADHDPGGYHARQLPDGRRRRGGLRCTDTGVHAERAAGFALNDPVTAKPHHEVTKTRRNPHHLTQAWFGNYGSTALDLVSDFSRSSSSFLRDFVVRFSSCFSPCCRGLDLACAASSTR